MKSVTRSVHQSVAHFSAKGLKTAESASHPVSQTKLPICTFYLFLGFGLRDYAWLLFSRSDEWCGRMRGRKVGDWGRGGGRKGCKSVTWPAVYSAPLCSSIEGESHVSLVVMADGVAAMTVTKEEGSTAGRPSEAAEWS